MPRSRGFTFLVISSFLKLHLSLGSKFLRENIGTLKKDYADSSFSSNRYTWIVFFISEFCENSESILEEFLKSNGRISEKYWANIGRISSLSYTFPEETCCSTKQEGTLLIISVCVCMYVVLCLCLLRISFTIRVCTNRLSSHM